MGNPLVSKHRARLLLALGMAGLLQACGGGGSANPAAPTPTPVSGPAPTPTPTPAPAAVIDPAEYELSNSARMADAITAFEAGAFGQGVAIAVIDSGIDADSREFAGRISALSRDVSSAGRTITDEDGHGTAIAGVAAAAANGDWILGLAPEAGLVVARADDPGTCGGADGCSFPDTNIARGVDLAVQTGAKVVNISLGGSAAAPALVRAIDRATAAGTVIVISAGNDGDANPDPLAQVALSSVARGRVLIAGALTARKARASFSNAAGTGREHYIAALGEGVRSVDENGSRVAVSGTSFAAPAVSGALALLFSAFPDLTADEAVAILKDSAEDLGQPGVDEIYGYGALDIGAAFAPQGGLSLAGSSAPVTSGPLLTAGGAAGDAGQAGSALETVVGLDGYGRAFTVDMSGRIARAEAPPRLAAALMARGEAWGLRAGRTALHVASGPAISSAADPLAARALDARGGAAPELQRGLAVAQLPGARVSAGHGYSAGALAQAAGGTAGELPLLLSGGPVSAEGHAAREGFGVAVALGSVEVAAAAARSDALVDGESGGAEQFRIEARRDLGGARVSLAWDHLSESGSLLGSVAAPELGIGSSRTDLAEVSVAGPLAAGLTFDVSLTAGRTDAHTGSGLAVRASNLLSSGFSAQLSGDDLFGGPGEFWGVSLSQPLRFEEAVIDLAVPTAFTYGSRVVEVSRRDLSLVPSGREIALEAVYGRAAGAGQLTVNSFYRHEPEHIAAASADVGGAVRFTAPF